LEVEGKCLSLIHSRRLISASITLFLLFLLSKWTDQPRIWFLVRRSKLSVNWCQLYQL